MSVAAVRAPPCGPAGPLALEPTEPAGAVRSRRPVTGGFGAGSAGRKQRDGTSCVCSCMQSDLSPPGRTVGAAGPGPDRGLPADAGAGVTALYQAHALALIRLAYLMLGDRASAEDVVQEAFCGLCRRAAADLRGGGRYQQRGAPTFPLKKPPPPWGSGPAASGQPLTGRSPRSAACSRSRHERVRRQAPHHPAGDRRGDPAARRSAAAAGPRPVPLLAARSAACRRTTSRWPAPAPTRWPCSGRPRSSG
jgi:hypothetical protein